MCFRAFFQKETSLLLILQRFSCYLLFLAFSDEYNYPAISLAACPPHSLHQADGWRMRIKANNQVYLANVQALLANTRGHQCVVAALTKPLHNLTG